jgi:hypothetical protein
MRNTVQCFGCGAVNAIPENSCITLCRYCSNLLERENGNVYVAKTYRHIKSGSITTIQPSTKSLYDWLGLRFVPISKKVLYQLTWSLLFLLWFYKNFVSRGHS